MKEIFVLVFSLIALYLMLLLLIHFNKENQTTTRDSTKFPKFTGILFVVSFLLLSFLGTLLGMDNGKLDFKDIIFSFVSVLVFILLCMCCSYGHKIAEKEIKINELEKKIHLLEKNEEKK